MTFRLADSLSFSVSGRPVVIVINEDTEERQAFYRSSGRNGGAEEGEWCPFHGWRWSFGTFWFIKRAEGIKRADAGSWQQRAAAWLSITDLPTPLRDHKWSGRVFRDADFAGKMRILRSVETCNEWFDFHGVPQREDALRLSGEEMDRMKDDVKFYFRSRKAA